MVLTQSINAYNLLSIHGEKSMHDSNFSQKLKKDCINL